MTTPSDGHVPLSQRVLTVTVTDEHGVVIFVGRPAHPMVDSLTLIAEHGKPTRLRCNLPDLSASVRA